MHDGLQAGQADFKPRDDKITLSEWLAYAVERVPVLAEEVRKGEVQKFGRGESSRTAIWLGNKKDGSLKKKNAFQTPALFDFTRNRHDAVLQK